MNLRWVLVMFAACGGKPTDPRSPSKPTFTKTEKPPPERVCIAPTDEAATIGDATSDGTQVQFCVGTGRVDPGKQHQCFAVDLGQGTFHRLVAPPKLSDRPRARVETSNPKVDVCAAGTCTSLIAKMMPNASTLRAATNEDGTYAVVLLGDAPKGRGYAEVWNVAKMRKAATFRYARGQFRCGDVAMLDNTIYLSAAQCGVPAARAGLYNLRGRKIANVGGRDFGSFGNSYVHLDDHTWAFLSENANKLVLQDVVKGKILKKLDTSTLFDHTGAKMGTPGESAMIRLRDGRLVVIAGSPATGSVATIDVTTGDIKVVPAPVCGG